MAAPAINFQFFACTLLSHTRGARGTCRLSRVITASDVFWFIRARPRVVAGQTLTVLAVQLFSLTGALYCAVLF